MLLCVFPPCWNIICVDGFEKGLKGYRKRVVKSVRWLQVAAKIAAAQATQQEKKNDPCLGEKA